jgi:hypothetical protein
MKKIDLHCYPALGALLEKGVTPLKRCVTEDEVAITLRTSSPAILS